MNNEDQILLEALTWLQEDASRRIGDPDQSYHGVRESSINIVKQLYKNGVDHVYINPEFVDLNSCASLMSIDIRAVARNIVLAMCTIAEMGAYKVFFEVYKDDVFYDHYIISIEWMPREERK